MPCIPPEGGEVRCAITRGGLLRDVVAIQVSDTGIGIPRADQDRVFEKLHRATNALRLVADGTGLGLYVVKSIVERAGGKISFESAEGQGTTFNVSLPFEWPLDDPKKL